MENESIEESTTKTILDFSQEYELRQKRFRPLAIIFILLFFIGLFAPFILIFYDEAPNFSKGILFLVFFPIMLSLYPIFKFLQCPSCDKFMGQIPGKFCPKCGVRIRRD